MCLFTLWWNFLSSKPIHLVEVAGAKYTEGVHLLYPRPITSGDKKPQRTIEDILRGKGHSKFKHEYDIVFVHGGTLSLSLSLS